MRDGVRYEKEELNLCVKEWKLHKKRARAQEGKGRRGQQRKKLGRRCLGQIFNLTSLITMRPACSGYNPDNGEEKLDRKTEEETGTRFYVFADSQYLK